MLLQGNYFGVTQGRLLAQLGLSQSSLLGNLAASSIGYALIGQTEALKARTEMLRLGSIPEPPIPVERQMSKDVNEWLSDWCDLSDWDEE